MSDRDDGQKQPNPWSERQLDEDRRRAETRFREQRMLEPLEQYLDRFDAIARSVESILEETGDFARLRERAVDILSDPVKREVFRYLAGPPISEDDLKVLVDARSLAPTTIRVDDAMVDRLVATIRDGLDRRRFPWVHEQRTATAVEVRAAIVATTALMATQRVATARRNEGKQEQERLVRDTLTSVGFAEVEIPGKIVRNIAAAPLPGQFCREVMFGERKADLVVGLWDRRIMPIECKVSNSSINSVKRLNNDAVVKATVWRRHFGELNVVSAAVLSGVFKLHNLQQAQHHHLSLYWAHRLSDLTDWMRARDLDTNSSDDPARCVAPVPVVWATTHRPRRYGIRCPFRHFARCVVTGQ
ncbi:MAG TPA: XamI family restriction endonuclease [Thermomicrobiales bacterium]|jgi:hypothetical protein